MVSSDLSLFCRVGDYKLILGEPRVVDFSLDPNGGFTIKLADPNSTDIRLFNLRSKYMHNRKTIIIHSVMFKQSTNQ